MDEAVVTPDDLGALNVGKVEHRVPEVALEEVKTQKLRLVIKLKQNFVTVKIQKTQQQCDKAVWTKCAQFSQKVAQSVAPLSFYYIGRAFCLIF